MIATLRGKKLCFTIVVLMSWSLAAAQEPVHSGGSRGRWRDFDNGSDLFISCWTKSGGSLKAMTRCSDPAFYGTEEVGSKDFFELGISFEYWFNLAQWERNTREDLERQTQSAIILGDTQKLSYIYPVASQAFRLYRAQAQRLFVTTKVICKRADWRHGFHPPGQDREKFCAELQALYAKWEARSALGQPLP
jgi:hypothetical protein